MARCAMFSGNFATTTRMVSIVQRKRRKQQNRMKAKSSSRRNCDHRETVLRDYRSFIISIDSEIFFSCDAPRLQYAMSSPNSMTPKFSQVVAADCDARHHTSSTQTFCTLDEIRCRCTNCTSLLILASLCFCVLFARSDKQAEA